MDEAGINARDCFAGVPIFEASYFYKLIAMGIFLTFQIMLELLFKNLR
jgi:hypothetical protein